MYKKRKAWIRDKSSLGIWRKFFLAKEIFLVESLKKWVITEFISWRLSQNTHKRTINTDLITIRKVLNWAEEEEIIAENPIKTAKITMFKIKNEIPRILTKEDIFLVETIAKSMNPDRQKRF